MKLSILCLLVIGWGVDGRPSHPTSAVGFPATSSADYSNHWTQFSKIKDLIDRINIKNFRSLYGNTKKGSEDSLVEIDLTEDALEPVAPDAQEVVDAADTTVAVAATTEAATAAVEVYAEERSGEEATTTSDVVDVADAVVTTVAAVAVDAADAADAADATTVAALLPEGDAAENEVVDAFFVSEETIQSAKKYGYKILLKKLGNGKTVPVGKIKFSFPTYVEIDHVSEPEAAAEAVTGESTEEEAPAPKEAVTEATADETTQAATVVSGDATTAAPVESEEATTTAVPEETTTAIAVVVPEVVEVVVPSIDQVSAESVNAGAAKVVEDTQLAVQSLQDIQEGVEVGAGCSVSMAEIEGLVVQLARNIRESTPIIEQIVSIGKQLATVEDTSELLRFGGDLLELLEPFLEAILPATSVSSCDAVTPNAMLVSLSSMATGMDVVANSVENQENGKSSSLHEAATSLQLAAWILSELQKSVYTLYQQEGTCGQNGSTVSILKTLAKAMDGYKPVFDVLGTETSIEELEETVGAINNAVEILEGLEAETGGLPGVSCTASLTEMGSALKQLADFVANLEASAVV